MDMDPFIALADPTRRQILESLATSERSFGELADQFEMSRPAVSQHLKVLRTTGLVTVRAEAQRRYYRLSKDGLDGIAHWLEKVRRFWPAQLDRLEDVLNEPQEQGENQ